MNLEYNFLNLVNRVTSGSAVKATYSWLADGTKLQVTDAAGNGFHYLGSLTYQQNGNTLQLEKAEFRAGVIRPTQNGGQEINYFLKDHLGSIRVITDANGTALERNDYYPFGSVHPRSDYPQMASNRFKYNGKEQQNTGNLNYLDYGARMYEPRLGRWMTIDPMAETYYPLSAYNYCANNPLLFKDPDGQAISPYYDFNGNFLGVDAGGFSGMIFITTVDNYKKIIKEQKVNKEAIPLQDADLSAEAYSGIYTDILEQTGYDNKSLYAGAVSVKKGDDEFNAPSKNVNYLMTTDPGENFFRISVNQKAENTKSELNTVENISNALGVHEYTGHGIFNWGDHNKTHHKVYELQFSDPTWSKTTSIFKDGIKQRYRRYLYDEAPARYRKIYKNLK